MDDLKYLIHENDQLRALYEAAIRQRDDARSLSRRYFNELEMIVVLGREQGVTLEPTWVARIAALVAGKEQNDGNT